MSNVARYELRATEDSVGLFATEKPNTHGMQYVTASAYDALLAERDALAKDAERYRFLMRELGGSVSQVVMGSPVFSNEDVNAAIDAARQGEQP